jgi:hypothetical protein
MESLASDELHLDLAVLGPLDDPLTVLVDPRRRIAIPHYSLAGIGKHHPIDYYSVQQHTPTASSIA